jgi:hypothetical protein
MLLNVIDRVWYDDPKVFETRLFELPYLTHERPVSLDCVRLANGEVLFLTLQELRDTRSPGSLLRAGVRICNTPLYTVQRYYGGGTAVSDALGDLFLRLHLSFQYEQAGLGISDELKSKIHQWLSCIHTNTWDLDPDYVRAVEEEVLRHAT